MSSEQRVSLSRPFPRIRSASSSVTIRCRSAGRVRAFFRNRILLARWRPRALPDAPAPAAAEASLDALAGPSLRKRVVGALEQADMLAGRIGGCARDAYTVLYGCAGFAVLFAACGVAVPGHGLLLDGLVLAELATLLILFTTFRNAHRVNWHSRWLGLRFHAEFLRCVPILVALRAESSPARHALQGRADAESLGLEEAVPHLEVLTGGHDNGDDSRLAVHESGQRELRAELHQQLHEVFLQAPMQYAGRCLSYARLLAQQQLRYHCLRAQQEQAIVHRVHHLSIAAFGMTIVAVLAHLLWHSPLLTIISTGVPAFAASLHGFLAQEESERLAASYRLMAFRIHSWLAVDIGTPDDLPVMQAHLAELVELMMSEVQDWHRLFGNKGMYHLG